MKVNVLSLNFLTRGIEDRLNDNYDSLTFTKLFEL